MTLIPQTKNCKDMIKKMKGPQQQTMESIECYLNDENKYYKAKNKSFYSFENLQVSCGS